MEKIDPTKRLILAAVIAFAFFAVYDLFFLETPRQTAPAQQQSAATQNPNAPAATASSASVTSPDRQVGSALAGERIIATVKTAVSTLEIDELGRIRQVSLSGLVFETEDHAQQKLLDPAQTRPLEIRFTDRLINDRAFNTPYQSDRQEADATQAPAELLLVQELGELSVQKRLVFHPNGRYELSVTTSSAAEYFISTGFRPVAATDPMTVQGSLVHTFDGTVETIEEGDAKGNEAFRQAKMVSSFDRYYASLLYNYDQPFDVYLNRVLDGAPLPFVRGQSELVLGGYIGPKYVATLKSIHPELTAAVEYGFFTFLSKPLFVVLEWIYAHIPNWGWAIVVFTLLVKVVLFPLSHKGMVGMARLKDLAPKMKELQEKYKDDKQKLQVHMMELYKKHGANPLGGCLPLLLQIPIFFAIYRVLINAIELKGAEWFYIADLSYMDPYFVLPVLMGATMWFQQRITPSNFTDPMQEKIFKWLPIIFTFFFLFFPAGLVLYWLINNVVSIGQQWFVNKRMEAMKLAAKKAAHHEKD
ncbi:MAG: membrane protein insertase YidC [Campylobacterales bacterium]